MHAQRKIKLIHKCMKYVLLGYLYLRKSYFIDT